MCRCVLPLANIAFACGFNLAAALGATASDDPAKAGSTVPSDPVFSALLNDSTTVSGRIQKVGPEAITLAVEEAQTISLKRLVKLTREGAVPPFPPEGALALFPDGDRLRSVIGSGGETTLEARSYLLGDIVLPIDSLLGLVFAAPTEVDAYELLLTRLRGQPRTSEVVWLVNGDRLTGGFLGLSPRRIAFQPGAEPVDIDRSQVVALGFDPALVNYPRPQGDFLELTLADGSRLGVRDIKVEKGEVEALTRFGAKIRLAIGDLSRVHVRSDSIAYLSERSENAVEYVSYVGPPREYRRNASVDGHTLRLAGQPYDRGLGTQSRTLLAYRLDARDRRFQALVGLDDRAGPLGSIVFRVSVDGKDRFVSPPMTVRDAPRAIDIEVSGSKVLILVTEFGERGEVRDFADWVEARLIR